MPLPRVGEVVDGYRYNGGDPKTKSSWAWVDPNEGKSALAVNSSAPGASYFGAGATAPTLPQEDRKFISELRKANQGANALRADANRFLELNKGTKTGGIQNLPVIGSALAMFDPRVAEMRAIAEKSVPAQREAGSGAMSDRDVEMYRAATFGTGKPGRANQAIIGVVNAGTKRENDYLAFMDEWGKNKKNLTGAIEAWNDYAEANPLFDNAGGNTKVRKTTPWREWFGLQTNRPSSQPKGNSQDIMAQARAAIKSGAAREAVIQRLKENGINPAGL